MADNENPGSVTWWWTPDCGALHIEENPVMLSLATCPDGLSGWSEESV